MFKKMLFLAGSIVVGLSFVAGASGFWQSTSDPGNADYVHLKSLQVSGTVCTQRVCTQQLTQFYTVENSVYQ